MKNVIFIPFIGLFFTNVSFCQMNASLLNEVENEQLSLIESSLIIKAISDEPVLTKYKLYIYR